MRAHPAGPLHGNIAPPTAAGAPPEDARRARPARLAAVGASGSTASCTWAACRSPSWPARTAPRCSCSTRATSAAGPRSSPRAFDDADVHYASKAFLCGQVARWIADDGLHLDACSGNELSLALAAGFPAERIALHGNNKSLVELRLAVDAGIGHVVVDSFDEIDRLLPLAAARVAAGGTPVPVLIRATVGIEAHTHEFIATAHEDQKFGFSLATGDALTAAVRVIREPALQLTGLHSHIGSQIFDTAGFEAAAHRVVGLLGQVHQATGEVLARAQPRRRLRHRLPVRGRPGEPARRRRQAARRHRRRVRPARPAGAAAGGRAGPGDRRARHRDALRDRHDQAGAAGRQRRAGHAAGAQLRLGGRRDERQHPHRPLRRQLHLRAGQPHAPTPRRRCAASWASTARAATSWCATCGCRRTCSPATCSPWPRPAPTAGRWRATTTTCSSLRWSPCGTAPPPRSSGVRHCPTCSPSTRSSPTCRPPLGAPS